MAVKLKRRNYGTTLEEVTRELQRVAKMLGTKTLTISQYQQHGRYGVEIMFRRFGGWVKALKIAGLKTDYERNIPIQKLFDNLEEVWIKLGRQPTGDKMRRPFSRYSQDTYISRFGSWRKALSAFEVYLNSAKGKKGTRRRRRIEKLQHTEPRTPRHPGMALRFGIMKRDKFKCVLCGRSPAKYPALELEIDHIIPWSKGGETVKENLQTLCSECNNGKRNS